jgi:hypothetical protein
MQPASNEALRSKDVRFGTERGLLGLMEVGTGVDTNVLKCV